MNNIEFPHVQMTGFINKVECNLCGQQFSGNDMKIQQDKHEKWHKTVGVSKNRTLGNVIWIVTDLEPIELVLVKNDG